METAKEILKVREDKMRTMGRIMTSVFDVEQYVRWYKKKDGGALVLTTP